MEPSSQSPFEAADAYHYLLGDQAERIRHVFECRFKAKVVRAGRLAAATSCANSAEEFGRIFVRSLLACDYFPQLAQTLQLIGGARKGTARPPLDEPCEAVAKAMALGFRQRQSGVRRLRLNELVALCRSALLRTLLHNCLFYCRFNTYGKPNHAVFDAQAHDPVVAWFELLFVTVVAEDDDMNRQACEMRNPFGLDRDEVVALVTALTRSNRATRHRLRELLAAR